MADGRNEPREMHGAAEGPFRASRGRFLVEFKMLVFATLRDALSHLRRSAIGPLSVLSSDIGVF
jgi:hypothetical protein